MIKKATVKRSLAIMVSIVLLFCMPLTALAETTITTAEAEEDYIYYSDLFYGYGLYLKSNFLSDYYNDTQDLFDLIYSDYKDSSTFAWSNIRNSLDKAFNIKDWCKIISDAAGLTTFTYEKALDAANIEFANKLLGGSELAKKI